MIKVLCSFGAQPISRIHPLFGRMLRRGRMPAACAREGDFAVCRRSTCDWTTLKESCDDMKKAVKDEAEKAPKEKNKSKLMKKLIRVLIIVLIVVIGVGGSVYLYAQHTKTHYGISFYQETSKKVSQNIRLAVIADIHNREYGKDNETLISDLRALKPDLILFAGDMVVKAEDDYRAVLKLVSNLTPIAPCYGVMGNHENERIYSKNDRELPERFEKAGLKLLRNAQEIIKIGGDTVQLIGVEGTAYGFEEYGGRAFMEKTAIDPSAYCVVMTHIPILFDKQLSEYPFDLGIAGHVHGGLVNLPRFGGLYSSEEGFFPDYCAGKYTLSGQQTLIISRGMGDSTPFPRINNMPELVIIDINCF